MLSTWSKIDEFEWEIGFMPKPKICLKSTVVLRTEQTGKTGWHAKISDT